MSPKRMRGAALLLATIAVGCGDARPPAPPAESATTPAPGKMRPLTSRDGVTPQVTPGPAQPLPPGHPPVDRSPDAALASGGAVAGRIDIAPNLKGRKGAALFVIARSASSGQILAVRKEKDAGFPHAFSISATDAMVEGTAFVGPFDVTARLSISGDAMPGKGDVEGTAKGVAAGAKGVAITLDTVRQ